MQYSSLISQIIHHRFFRFCVVGGSGFLVDSSLFLSLTELSELNITTARIVAFWSAASWNWYCNRLFTFQSLEMNSLFPKVRQWLSYMGTSAIGFIPNVGIFLLLTQFTSLGSFPFVALTAGILAGLVCNYILASRFVFKVQTQS